MAQLRTYEEKLEILKHCIELEKSGGDILGYLWSQDYLTPRATWFNYQREWLGRKPYQYTDGKPKKRKGTNRNMANAKTDRQKLLDRLLERMAKGESAKEALKNLGYDSRSLGQTYRQLRIYAIDMDPKFAEILPERLNAPGNKYLDMKVIVKDGVEYEKAEKDAPEVHTISTATDMVDAYFGKNDSASAYDGDKDDRFDELVIISRKTAIRYEYSKEYGQFSIKYGADEIVMEPEVLKNMIMELKAAARRLGVNLC